MTSKITVSHHTRTAKNVVFHHIFIIFLTIIQNFTESHTPFLLLRNVTSLLCSQTSSVHAMFWSFSMMYCNFLIPGVSSLAFSSFSAFLDKLDLPAVLLIDPSITSLPPDLRLCHMSPPNESTNGDKVWNFQSNDICPLYCLLSITAASHAAEFNLFVIHQGLPNTFRLCSWRHFDMHKKKGHFKWSSQDKYSTFLKTNITFLQRQAWVAS